MLPAAVICLAVAGGYFDANPRECKEVFSFVDKYQTEINTALTALPADDRVVALSVVAPELSQFSNFFNAVEMRTLYIMYLNSGAADFSVGYFQMKPSFVEGLENIIRKNATLKKKYSDILPSGSVRKQRQFRLKNLAGLNGQLRYLCAYIDIVKIRTKNIQFKNDEEKVKYWATLYNSGMFLSPAQVKKFQTKKLFPKFGEKYNYADVAYEFYKAFCERKK